VSRTAKDQPPATAGGSDQANIPVVAGGLNFCVGRSYGYFAPGTSADSFKQELLANGTVEINGDLYEVLRIENGIPKYGIDMDETTIVPELGIEGLISYNKGCYIGQEIIARIYFRGHVAKQLTGIVLSVPGAIATELSSGSVPRAVATGALPADLTTTEGKNAGRITSNTFSPALNKTIALAYVRYDYLSEGTELMCGEHAVTVKDLPFSVGQLQETA
jgi:folate-binding protein YgfZ